MIPQDDLPQFYMGVQSRIHLGQTIRLVQDLSPVITGHEIHVLHDLSRPAQCMHVQHSLPFLEPLKHEDWLQELRRASHQYIAGLGEGFNRTFERDLNFWILFDQFLAINFLAGIY